MLFGKSGKKIVQCKCADIFTFVRVIYDHGDNPTGISV